MGVTTCTHNFYSHGTYGENIIGNENDIRQHYTTSRFIIIRSKIDIIRRQCIYYYITHSTRNSFRFHPDQPVSSEIRVPDIYIQYGERINDDNVYDAYTRSCAAREIVERRTNGLGF